MIMIGIMTVISQGGSSDRGTVCARSTLGSEGGMKRLETLIELRFLNSSCSSLSSY